MALNTDYAMRIGAYDPAKGEKLLIGESNAYSVIF